MNNSGNSNLNSTDKINNTNSSPQLTNEVNKDDSYNHGNHNRIDDVKGDGSTKGLPKKIPLKYKFIGCIAAFAFIIIFIVVLITPLMKLGIIEISDSSGCLIYCTSNGEKINVTQVAKTPQAFTQYC